MGTLRTRAASLLLVALLLCAAPARAAITEVASQLNTVQANGWATQTVAFPNNVTAGNLVVFIGGFWNTTLITSVTCAKSSGTATVGSFTSLIGPTGTGWAGGTGIAAICYAVVTGTGSLTLVLSTNVGSGNTVSGTTDEFTGQDTSTPLDANGTENTGTSTSQSASVTTTLNNSLVLAVQVINGGDTINVTWSGATQMFEDETSSFQPNNALFKVVGAAGAQTATWTTTGGDTFSAIALAIREAGAAPSAAVPQRTLRGAGQ